MRRLKVFLFIVAIVKLMSSCDSLESLKHDHEKDSPCQIVSSELVPQIVKDSLAAHYPGVVPIKWLNKDNTGYCVNFIGSDTKDVIALFSNTGNFISQEENNNIEQTGQHTDNQPEASGCSCEIDDSNKN